MIKNGETVEFKKENRRAVIVEETHYVVKMYVGDELAEERPMYGKICTAKSSIALL